MRYLIDTNIFVYAVIDRDSLDRDVTAILQEPDTVLYMSAESVRELIVGYRNKGLCSKRWKSVVSTQFRAYHHFKALCQCLQWNMLKFRCSF